MAASRSKKIAAVPRFNGLAPKSATTSATARASSKKRDTKCELLLRRELWRRGARYRTDAEDLPGRPDILFRRAKVAVFVDGDFWHGRDLEKRLSRLSAGHNARYWVQKITTNVARDRRHDALLEQDGWLVVRVWETDVRNDAAGIGERIASLVAARLADAV